MLPSGAGTCVAIGAAAGVAGAAGGGGGGGGIQIPSLMAPIIIIVSVSVKSFMGHSLNS